jgi:uroporphyrinogen-III synthase
VKGPVIVTRPASAGERLYRRLRAAGWDALWWPAFELGAASDPAHVRSTLTRLADFDLAVFVSPSAVAAVAGLRNGRWPASTIIGAVGAATAAAAREQLNSEDAIVVAPADGGPGGSEAFWSTWQQRGLPARRVLILRAQHGREWLSERFAETGAEVEPLAVYTRSDRTADAVDQARLQSAVEADASVVCLFSSSEAIAALDRQVAAVADAAAWLRRGIAIATHPRIRDGLLAAGYRRVEMADPDDDVLIGRLELL